MLRAKLKATVLLIIFGTEEDKREGTGISL